MRIAQIAPLYEAVPPRLYGGTERIVAYLSDALVDAGHEVTLFASGDSQTRANLVPCRRQAIRLDASPLKWDIAAHLAMLADVRRRADDFDVLHFHLDILHFPFFEDCAGHTLTTQHGRLDIEDLLNVHIRWPSFPLVSVSEHQRRPLPRANWVATVPHGLPRDLLPFSAGPGQYLAFLGRCAPEKGVDRAIAIARRTGIPLKIAAKVDAADRAYYLSEIEPLIDPPFIEHVGEIGETEKAGFLGGALALLFPIAWPEPFGLVMIEAMACGTPVIAWRNGSVPEVIEPGVSGVIVDTVDEAAAAVGRIGRIDRFRVRQAFERRFTATTMATRYVDLYGQLAGGRTTRIVAQQALPRVQLT